MFHEPADVTYYQPAELVTKHGLRGHIREPVGKIYILVYLYIWLYVYICIYIGTHGLFKAIFNAPIKQNDTIMLILYKRVYPKLANDTVTNGSNQMEE